MASGNAFCSSAPLSTACILVGVNPGELKVSDSKEAWICSSSGGGGEVITFWYGSGEKRLFRSGCNPVRLGSSCLVGCGCGGGLCTAGIGLEMELVVTVFSPGR